MRETPLTDKEVARVGTDGDGDAYLHAGFARALETDLAAAQMANDTMNAEHRSFVEDADKEIARLTSDLAAANERAERAEREARAIDTVCGEWTRSSRGWAQSYADLKLQAGALRAALEKYGEHASNCDAFLCIGACTCGFAESLTPTETKGTE